MTVLSFLIALVLMGAAIIVTNYAATVALVERVGS